MAIPFGNPIVCPLVVGRAPHLAALDTHFDAVRGGDGQTVLLTGEAGVGKSRLATEARSRARARGMLILEGRCYEPDRTLPYAALVDLLRNYIARQPAETVIGDLGDIPPQLTRLLPEIAAVVPGEAGAGAETATLEPELETRHLGRALADFVMHLAGAQPVLVIIEDLHWSDDAGLSLVLHLARLLTGAPALLLLTYRNDEVHPTLRHMLALLDRERLASEISLSRLTPPEVDLMLRAIFDQPQPIRADFLHAIYELTDGNPFFIEEVVRALIAAGDIFRSGTIWGRRTLTQLRIPRSIQDAVMRRVQQLSSEAAQVLRVAAVAGRSFDFDILMALTQHDEHDLLRLIRDLVAAQLVMEESADRFAFRHALTRQAIYAGMLARERRALHLKIASELERRHAEFLDPWIADLSYHASTGGAWEKAIEYGEQAGIRALQLYAPSAALEHFTHAIEAASRLAITPTARLYRGRGRALALVGEFEPARADFLSALERAKSDRDQFAEWQALLDLGDVWTERDYVTAGHYFDEAYALAQQLNRAEAEAESLARLGGWYLNTERPDEAETYLQSALRLYEQTGDRRGIARTVDLLGTASDIAGDVIEMRRRYEHAADLFRALGDREGLSSTLATMLLYAGGFVFETVVTPAGVALNQSIREAEEATALARDIGWRAGEAYALTELAVCLGERGEYGSALERAREGLSIAEEIHHGEWMTAGYSVHCAILLDLLAPRPAEQHAARAYEIALAGGSLHWLHLTTAYLAETWLAKGERQAAAELLARLAPDLPMRTLGQRRVWTARARLALDTNDPKRAVTIIDQLFAGAVNLTGERDIPLLALLRGESLIELRRYHEAQTALQAAFDGAVERGLRPLQWRAQRALVRLLTARGQAAEARQHVRAAWVIVDGLAATLPDAIRSDFLAAVDGSLPADRSRLTRQEGQILTARERDVAELVTRGLSNREIADALSIGERTVETHVSNILGKLEFTSRAQIAVWVAQGYPGPTSD